MLADKLRREAGRAWQRLLPAPRETGPAAAGLRAKVAETGAVLERMLEQNLVAFWYPRCLDEQYGGYRFHHDVAGRYKGPANKGVIAQARTLWFFARLARSGRNGENALAAAGHGFRFLAERLWDPRHGGFFWEVDPTGARPTVRDKYFFAQSFALYALSEYALATGDGTALRLAGDTFELLDRELRDPAHGGYWDRLREDWTPGDLPPTLTRSSQGVKTMNVQLHALEAVTTYLEASHSLLARERLEELLRIETERVFRPVWGACTDAHTADWTPLLDRANARMSYGHDLENISLVLSACAVLDLPAETHLPLFRTLFGSALRWGFDRRHGGFYKEGPLGRPADDRSKSWWVQAEALAAALEMFRLSGDGLYANCYLKTLGWILSRHVDWEYGEWHATPPRRGTPAEDKAGPWKEPYHTGRTLIRCLELCGR